MVIAIIVIIIFLCAILRVAGLSSDKKVEESNKDSVDTIKQLVLESAEDEDFKDCTAINVESSSPNIPYISFLVNDAKEKIKIYLGKTGHSEAITYDLRYDDIISAELQEDGKTTESKKSLSLGKAVLGGLVGGGVGAVIGGVHGNAETAETSVKSLRVHILLRNKPQPAVDINFLDTVTPYSVGVNSPDYINRYQKAKEIMDYLNVAIDRVDSRNGRIFVADELYKLLDLKNQGVLTDEEFAAQKKLLLSASSSVVSAPEKPRLEDRPEPLMIED